MEILTTFTTILLVLITATGNLLLTAIAETVLNNELEKLKKDEKVNGKNILISLAILFTEISLVISIAIYAIKL